MPNIFNIGGKTVADIQTGGKTVKSIYDSTHSVLLWEKSSAEPDYFYFEDRSGSANTLTCTKTGDAEEWFVLEYSTDKSTWTSWDLSQSLAIPANGKVYLRGSNTYGFGKDNSNYHTFTCSDEYAVGGELWSVMNSGVSTVPARFGSRTFNGSTTLVDASDLVFPSLPVETVAFTWMFQNCSALEGVPENIDIQGFVAGGTGHFTQVFQNCPVGNFPKFRNLTTLDRNCMYRIVQSSAGSPNTNLTEVDLSNITTLYSQGLYQAFTSNTALEVVKIGISAWPDLVDSSASDYNATYQWLNNVHSTGVFCKNSSLPIIRDVSHIPANWSIADLNGKLYAPVITVDNGTVTIAHGGDGVGCYPIYYTTDGRDPKTYGTLYEGPFAMPATPSIKAVEVYQGLEDITDSDVTVYSNPSTVRGYKLVDTNSIFSSGNQDNLHYMLVGVDNGSYFLMHNNNWSNVSGTNAYYDNGQAVNVLSYTDGNGNTVKYIPESAVTVSNHEFVCTRVTQSGYTNHVYLHAYGYLGYNGDEGGWDCSELKTNVSSESVAQGAGMWYHGSDGSGSSKKTSLKLRGVGFLEYGVAKSDHYNVGKIFYANDTPSANPLGTVVVFKATAETIG